MRQQALTAWITTHIMRAYHVHRANLAQIPDATAREIAIAAFEHGWPAALRGCLVLLDLPPGEARATLMAELAQNPASPIVSEAARLALQDYQHRTTQHQQN